MARMAKEWKGYMQNLPCFPEIEMETERWDRSVFLSYLALYFTYQPIDREVFDRDWFWPFRLLISAHHITSGFGSYLHTYIPTYSPALLLAATAQAEESVARMTSRECIDFPAFWLQLPT